MITINETIQWVTEEYAHLIFGESEFVGDERAYEAVMTILSTLEYAKLLEDKFGSLEEALEAEEVVHCWECYQYHPDKSYCERVCENKVFRLPNDFCSGGITRKRIVEIADKFNNIGTVNPISPVGLRAALKLYEDAMDKEDIE